ncbi:18357_t:CDS:2 [Funneliformis geosporum]|uniref:5340_t:CDS:1 n=1 Tax=Funneliformis geosporum TaxID=1117311 RepID=A0A9W4SKH3_9GLOM|nr:18357_t:CDS:2 [Funneliformis geosporum]CAI2173257.1 5340_t:CDS:2 [Funneliformis geosporum]
MERSQRIDVQEKTIEAFNKLNYVHPRTNKVIELSKELIEQEIHKAKFYPNGSALTREIVPEFQEKPDIKVVDGDCLKRALEMVREGFNPLVLNMASATKAGGGYKNGAGAQEENLFRRTNLYQYHERNKKNWYPIPSLGGVYCPNATVIRSSEHEKYEFLEVPKILSFVAVAAIRRPKIIKDQSGEFTLTPEDIRKTRHKIRSILNIGLHHGHDSIVLSAFGCGAYGNPPSTMAQLFYDVISNEYAGGGENLPKTYRHISFAIFDDNNASKKHNPEGNLLPFKNRFANGVEDKQIKNVDSTIYSTSIVSQDNESPKLINEIDGNKTSNNDQWKQYQNNEREGNDGRGGWGGRGGRNSWGGRGGRNNWGGRGGRGDRGGRGGRGRRGNSQSRSSNSSGQTTLDTYFKPSQDQLCHLKKKGYSEANIARAFNINKGDEEGAMKWLNSNVVPDEFDEFDELDETIIPDHNDDLND